MIEVLYFEGCPNYEPTLEFARDVVAELGLEAESDPSESNRRKKRQHNASWALLRFG